MSELKAFDVGLGRCTEDGYPCVVAFDADGNPRLLGDEKVYLKDDVDKVIAELEEERRWRKFPEEKPEWGKEVIVVDDANKQYIVRFSCDMKWISWGNMNTCESKCVKYWMPQPSAPKEYK